MSRALPQLVSVKLEKLHSTQITAGKEEVAMKLAASQDARYLPGWSGVIAA